MDKPTIKYEVRAEMGQTPVRGNASVSGDAEADKATEDEILARLDSGDVWAWADVTVRASVTIEGEDFEGFDHLGCCSYRDEEDFKREGYYEDMCHEARRDLRRHIKATVERGRIAARALALES